MTEAVAPAVEDKAVRETQKNTKKSKNTDVEPTEAVEVQTAPLNVYQRMIVAQRAIDAMPWVKDLTNAQFKSIPIDAMRNGVRKACIQAGLVCVGPLDLRYDVQSRDGRIKVYTGTAVFRYINADDPQEYIDFPSLGEAMDTGDKGAGKLVSNLIKTHYKTCFDIGEQGKDDIDSYANEDIEAEADRIAERRARRAEAVKKDPFFGKPAEAQPDEETVRLRKQVGAFSMMGEPYATIIKGHKASRPFPEWDLAMLRSVLAECEAAKEGGQ